MAKVSQSEWVLQPRTRRLLTCAVLGLAVVCTIVGMGALARFEQTPGQFGKTPARWPESSSLRQTHGRPEVLVFAHPYCSCTAATLNELVELNLSHWPQASRPVTRVLFYRKRGSGWKEGRQWKQAELSGARVSWDEDGVEARRFGVQTSGHVLLTALREICGSMADSPYPVATRVTMRVSISFARLSLPNARLHPVSMCMVAR